MIGEGGSAKQSTTDTDVERVREGVGAEGMDIQGIRRGGGVTRKRSVTGGGENKEKV